MFYKKAPSAVANARPQVPEKTAGLLREAWWLALVAIGLFLAAILVTYHPDDPSWSHSASNATAIHNLGGVLGAWLSDMLLYLFGLSAWWWAVLAFMGIWWAYRRLESQGLTDRPILFYHLCGFTLMLVASSALEAGHLRSLHAMLPLAPGGMLGTVVDDPLVKVFGFAGSTLGLLLAFAVGFSLFTGVSWLTMTERLGAALEWAYLAARRAWTDRQDRRAGQVAEPARDVGAQKGAAQVEQAPTEGWLAGIG